MVSMVVSVVVTLTALVSLSEVHLLVSIQLDGQVCAWESAMEIDVHDSLDYLTGNK